MAPAELDDLRFDALTRVAPLAHRPILPQKRSVLLNFGRRCGSVNQNESAALKLARGYVMSMRYDEPNRAARAANALIRWLAELGISIAGTRALSVRGRKTGKRRSVVVNMLTVDGADYLVSPRGTTQWVRNVRAAGLVEVGPRWRRRQIRATEVADAQKPELLRRYLDRWYWEVKGHIAGLMRDSSDEDLRAAAPSIPVFALANPR
jgi:deazaflavin-dependent oxidoreductase (nitroreductase family)